MDDIVIILQAERIFSEARSLEPYHLEGMEIFSTALWHLQREVELSALAQEMTDMEKNSPALPMPMVYTFILLLFARFIATSSGTLLAKSNKIKVYTIGIGNAGEFKVTQENLMLGS
jgi:hypothetical protein